MKRCILAAVTMAAVAVPASALATAPTREHLGQYNHDYAAVARQFGHRAPGRNIVRWGERGHPATDAEVMASLAVLGRFLAPPPPPAAPAASAPAQTTNYSSSGGLADVPGVPAAFAACVALRESSNGTASSNVYGIIARDPGSTLAQQKATFSQMYQQMGTAPWAPYDGC